MSEREDTNGEQARKVENLNFSFQDILDEGVNNPSNPNFQHIVATFQNHDNQSASYNNLPADLQDLFSMPEPNTSSDISMWNRSANLVKEQESTQQSTTPTEDQQQSSQASSPFNNQASPATLNTGSTQASPLQSAPSPQTHMQASPTPMAPQTQSASTPVNASPHQQQLAQKPLNPSPQIATRSSTPSTQSPKVIAPQVSSPSVSQQLQPAVPQQPSTQVQSPAVSTPVSTASSTTENAPSSMTLLDNITAQLSPDRKDKFIELFRQLQTTAVTAPEFLAQAKQLLDQQQYQQLENLKGKPTAPPPRPNTPIQPHQPQLLQHNNNTIKRPMSSSQVRAEDTQRAMSGLIAPQAKRSRTSDIPINTSQPSPLYRPTGAVTQQQQQILLQQKQQQMQLQQQQLMQQQQQQQMKQHLLQQHQQQQLLQQQQQQSMPSQPSQIPAQQLQTSLEDEEGNSTITQDFMNPEMLTAMIAKISQNNDLTVGADVVTLIALATQSRIVKFIHRMIAASKHRVDSQTFTQPTQDDKGNQPFKIADVQDIKKQLLAIERVEREEERKRKEIISERERKAQLGEEANEGGDDDGSGKPAKKKKKKDMGPGVTARYMSDDARNKTTNETALMIAGGVMKSWMLTGATGGAKDNIKPQQLPLSRQNSNMDVVSPSSATMPGMDTSPSLATSPTNTSFGETSAVQEEQPRGRGRPRRRKSGSGPDIMIGKKAKGFSGVIRNQDGGLTLPPSKIGRPHRLGEQSARKLTARDALFVLEDENENKRDAAARRTLLKAYATLR